MQIKAEIAPDGTLKVLEPQTVLGTEVFLTIEDEKKSLAYSTWPEVKQHLQQARNLPIPKRTPKDILDDLRYHRGTE